MFVFSQHQQQYAVETLIVFPLLGYFVVSPVLLTRAAAELPPWYVVVAQLVVIFLSTDFLFYWVKKQKIVCFPLVDVLFLVSVRLIAFCTGKEPREEKIASVTFALSNTFFFFLFLFFRPPLYKRIHKQHHEFTVTTSITFEYSHPVETLTNLLSVTIPPLVLGTHPFVTAASLGLRMWESVDCHCGYELPYWLSPWQIIRRTARHNFHVRQLKMFDFVFNLHCFSFFSFTA